MTKYRLEAIKYSPYNVDYTIELGDKDKILEILRGDMIDYLIILREEKVKKNGILKKIKLVIQNIFNKKINSKGIFYDKKKI